MEAEASYVVSISVLALPLLCASDSREITDSMEYKLCIKLVVLFIRGASTTVCSKHPVTQYNSLIDNFGSWVSRAFTAGYCPIILEEQFFSREGSFVVSLFPFSFLLSVCRSVLSTAWGKQDAAVIILLFHMPPSQGSIQFR